MGGKPRPLPAAAQLVQGAAEGLAGGIGAVVLGGDPLALLHGRPRAARRRVANPGIGRQLPRRITGDIAQQKGHGGRIGDFGARG